jgi:hypothetical protein
VRDGFGVGLPVPVTLSSGGVLAGANPIALLGSVTAGL